MQLQHEELAEQREIVQQDNIPIRRRMEILNARERDMQQLEEAMRAPRRRDP
jgi:hypothetical protein